MKKLFIVVLALAFCLAALPALAQDKAEWNWYGQIRMWTAWESASKETQKAANLSSGSKARGWNAGFNNGLQDDDVLDWQLQTNSRLGVNVKWGHIGAQVEFGHDGDPTWSGSRDVRASFRLLSATWNFGPGTLLAGKNYTPYFFLVSSLCGPGGGECNGIGFGSIYGGRRAQLTLQMGGFKLGFVEPETRVTPSNVLALAPYTLPATSDTDQWLPRIEASYTFNLGPAAIFLGGAYQTYDYEIGTAAGIEEITNDSWALGLGWRSAFGPLYVNGTFQYGNNIGQGGLSTILQFSRSLLNPVTFETEDNTYMTAQLILGFKLMDSLSIEGGVIWQEGDGDLPIASGGSVTQDSWVYYVNATWSPAKNVFIVPEFGIIDNGDLEITGLPDNDLGKVTWFGIKWQINF